MKLNSRIVLILLIAVISLVGLNKLYEIGHTRYFSHQAEKFNVLLNKETVYYDILLIGSSRMHVHYNPFIIDSITRLSSYNFGVEGGNLLETNLWLQRYLSLHKKPAAVLLDLNSFAFDIEHRPFFNPTIYFPYLDDPVINHTVAEYKKIGLFRYLPFLELMEVDDYNKYLALLGWLGKKEEFSSHYTYHGFADNGSGFIKPGTALVRDTNFFRITQTGKKLLNSIIDTCSKKGIKLIIAYSPEYYDTDYSKRVEFFDYIHEVTSNNNIPFWDYRNLPISHDSTLFADPSHLNKYGADIFSRQVATDLVTELSIH